MLLFTRLSFSILLCMTYSQIWKLSSKIFFQTLGECCLYTNYSGLGHSSNVCCLYLYLVLRRLYFLPKHHFYLMKVSFSTQPQGVWQSRTEYGCLAPGLVAVTGRISSSDYNKGKSICLCFSAITPILLILRVTHHAQPAVLWEWQGKITCCYSVP